MKVRDVLTAEPMTVGQIGNELDRGVPPYKPRTSLDSIREELAILVVSGAVARVRMRGEDGWRLAGAS